MVVARGECIGRLMPIWEVAFPGTQVIKEAIYDAFYKLTDSRSQITAYVFDVVRASVPRMDLDEIFVVRTHIGVEVDR